MSILASLGWIIIGIIIIAAILIGIFLLLFYTVGSALCYQKQTQASAWDYWETHKCKSWSELSDEENGKNGYC